MDRRLPGALHLGYLAIISLVLLTPAPAVAQDRSERIDQLEILLARQQAQLDALQDQIGQLLAEREDVAVAPASPRGVSSSSDTVGLRIYGQVNRGVLFANDGHNKEAFNVDNDHSSTRLGLVGEAKPREDLTIGANIEVQMESNSSAAVNQAQNAPGGGVTFTERKLEVYAKSGHFGAIWAGQGSTASDGTAESDLSGTAVAGRANFGEFGGGLSFATSGTGAIAGNPTVGTVFSNMDGLSRNDRLRYDAPNIHGLALATSWIDGGQWDFGARYSRDFAGNKFAAGLGYANPSGASATISDQVSASASFLLGSGWNVSISAGQRGLKAAGRSDPDFVYGKLGYRAKWSPLGRSNFAVDYGQVNDLALNGDEAKMYGAQFVQNLDGFGLELYLSYRNYSLERRGANFDDIDVALGGARVKF